MPDLVGLVIPPPQQTEFEEHGDCTSEGVFWVGPRELQGQLDVDFGSGQAACSEWLAVLPSSLALAVADIGQVTGSPAAPAAVEGMTGELW